MKTKIFYECEMCDKISTDIDIIQICEASHLGLTLEEYRHYGDLKYAVKAYSAIIHRTNNEENRNKKEQAIKRLMEFEKEHDIPVL